MFSPASLEARKAQKEHGRIQNENVQVESGNTHEDESISVQAVAVRSINHLSFDSEARSFLLSRRASPLGLSPRYTSSRTDVEKAFNCAKLSAYHDALAWLKTITNGWCTSTRMHEPVHLKCIFGCRDAKDCISHYLKCVTSGRLSMESFKA